MITLDPNLQKALVTRVSDRIIAHTDELVTLDQAIGDGDHGLNMKRGFEAVMADIDRISSQSLADALKTIAMALIMKVGGASGPLYGTLFQSLGKSLPEQLTREGMANAFAAAIDAVKARGKSDVGQKTMLDVLAPLLQTLREVNDETLFVRLRATAQSASEATVPMKATRGRASFLGERSIGHMDPGARSSALIMFAILDVLEGKS